MTITNCTLQPQVREIKELAREIQDLDTDLERDKERLSTSLPSLNSEAARDSEGLTGWNRIMQKAKPPRREKRAPARSRRTSCLGSDLYREHYREVEMVKRRDERRKDLIRKLKGRFAGLDLEATFMMWDTNGDGTLSKHELQCGVDRLGFNLLKHDIRHIFQEMDSNNDGQIDMNEFQTFAQGKWDGGKYTDEPGRVKERYYGTVQIERELKAQRRIKAEKMAVAQARERRMRGIQLIAKGPKAKVQHFILHTIPYTLHSLYTVLYEGAALHPPHYTLYTALTLYTVLYEGAALHPPHYTLYTALTVHCTLPRCSTSSSTLYPIHCTHCTLHSTKVQHFILHTIPYTPYTLHSLYTVLYEGAALHPPHYTLYTALTVHCTLRRCSTSWQHGSRATNCRTRRRRSTRQRRNE
jgi:hypothetical protein